jgi:hypothetical protein
VYWRIAASFSGAGREVGRGQESKEEKREVGKSGRETGIGGGRQGGLEGGRAWWREEG